MILTPADGARTADLVAGARHRRKRGRTMSDYEMQAVEFLKKAGAQMTISRTDEVHGFPFDKNDTLWHYKYQITLTRQRKQYRFTFYDCFNNWLNNKRPTRYDVLASVEKYAPPAGVENFAREYGYEIDTPEELRRIKKIYEACDKQYNRLRDLFGDELMAELQEIN